MTLELVRLTEDDGATLGILIVNNWPSLSVLENAWRGNRRGESCIPKGTYKMQLHHSPKFGKTYHILDVPERSEIIFHSGNTPKDTKGCILLGMGFRRFDGQAGIDRSKKAMEKFLTIMGNAPHGTLIIR